MPPSLGLCCRPNPEGYTSLLGVLSQRTQQTWPLSPNSFMMRYLDPKALKEIPETHAECDTKLSVSLESPAPMSGLCAPPSATRLVTGSPFASVLLPIKLRPILPWVGFNDPFVWLHFLVWNRATVLGVSRAPCHLATPRRPALIPGLHSGCTEVPRTFKGMASGNS